MIKNINKQIKKELYVFQGLSVVNIIFSAITLAIGIVLIVNNLFTLIETADFINYSTAYVIIGFGLAGIGFFWILPSASLLDFVTDIQFKYFNKKTDNNEKITGLIIKMISYYREESNNIKKMIIISRLGGTFFLLNGIISSIDFFININSNFQISNHFIQIIGIILMFSWGILSFFIPRFIKKFATLWEARIKKSQEAEEIFKKHLESN